MIEVPRVEDRDDDYPGGWFGQSWGAPICDEDRHRPTPVGEPCVRCGAPITDDDQGMIMPHIEGKDRWYLVAYTIDCFLESIGIASIGGSA